MKKRIPIIANRPNIQSRAIFAMVLAGLFLFLAAPPAKAVPPHIPPDESLPFFTNTAAHLLEAQLTLKLNRIQLYPTSQYTPAVHRLLQVAANLCDATAPRDQSSYPYLPSIFRPLFTNDNGIIYISGYAKVNGTELLSARMRDLTESADRDALEADDVVYGIPVVVGARKGLPNFNEFAMETAFSVSRRLQFVAPLPRDPRSIRPFETNQMYVVGISNVFGIEAWNSYTNPYPRPLQLTLSVDMTGIVTNQAGRMLLSNYFEFGTNQSIATWDGFLDPNHAGNSLKIPFSPATSQFLFLTNSTYVHSADRFIPITSSFERDQHPPFDVPQWWLQLRTRLRFVILDVGVNPPAIVDYVNLAHTEDPIDLTYNLMRDGSCGATYAPPIGTLVPDGMFWCTNRSEPFGPTFGIRLQIDVSDGFFNARPYPTPGPLDQHLAIDFFRMNLLGLAPKFGNLTYLTNVFYTPYNPARTLYISTSWSANDPLVHYTLNDLQDLTNTDTNRVATDDSLSRRKISNIGLINDRYQPWGGASVFGQHNSSFDIGLKDPLVRRSDDWSFPARERLAVESLGSIHRGTPWQTIYLKSPAVRPEVWSGWLGTSDSAAAAQMHPTNDWRMVSLLISLLGKGHPEKLLSINQATFSDWQSVLKGIHVLTNTTADPSRFAVSEFDDVVMHPKSPQIETIIADIYATRAMQPHQVWGDRGDIMATPALSVASPWLNETSLAQVLWGINDEAYERIPSQLLQRLRSDSVGVIKPHPKGLKFAFSGMPGSSYVIETSSDLINWAPVSTNYCSDGIIEWNDNTPAIGSSRFYRSVFFPADEYGIQAEAKP